VGFLPEEGEERAEEEFSILDPVLRVLWFCLIEGIGTSSSESEIVIIVGSGEADLIGTGLCWEPGFGAE
jgi:hypothetical protein